MEVSPSAQISKGKAINEKVHVRVDMQHGWQCKSDRFSGPGLRDCNEVATAEGHRPSLTLDWCGFFETLLLNGAHQIAGESNFIKVRDGAWNVSALHLERKIFF